MAAIVEGAAPGGADDAADDRRAALVLADLRRARRRRRTAEFDIGEAVYRAYITFIVVGVTVWLASGIVGDQRMGPSAAARVARDGPQVVGAVIAAGFAVGLRSGGRGGPLVIEAADVRHVLLAPVGRAVALRLPALRQLRFGAAVGAGAGAVAGLLAYRRLPGGIAGWLACGALVGALAASAGLGLAMLMSGRRVHRVAAGLVAVLVAGWSALDLAQHLATSPATFLGQLALWPLRFRATGVIGVAVAVAAAAVGWAAVPGVSIEAAERRASLVGQIRFAATLRDLRTVVVLRRQLTQEQPRQRPWIRLPRAVALPGAGSAHRRRWPVWRRSWHGIARFPAVRFARMALLGAAGGAAVVGVWRGTTPLLLVAGAALYVAGLDAVEPLAQEIDHPDRCVAYPVEAGDLMLRQLGPSVAVMIGVCLVGLATGVAISGGGVIAAEIGGITVLPAALAGVASAAMSVIQGAPVGFSSTDNLLPPEAAGFRAIARIALPPLVALVGAIPVLGGRNPGRGIGPVAATSDLVAPVLLVVTLVGAWIRYRESVRAWFRAASEEATAARRRPAPQ